MTPSAERIFHVTPDQARMTLASLLRLHLPRESWTQIRRLITSRRVQVDGNLCLDAARRLRGGEVVRILRESGPALPTEQAVQIVHLDSQLVVVNKPAGVTSVRHELEKNWPRKRQQFQPTLDELVAKKLTPAKSRQPVRVRPVHRLDRDTSGLIVFARTAEAEKHLMQQFRHHTTGRRYLALVYGHVEAARYESWLVRDRGDGRRGSLSAARGDATLENLPAGRNAKMGKHAVTHVRPLERLDGYTLIECQLETGRTHQIRIHLSEAGHPVCGDRMYRQPWNRPVIPDRSRAPRLALHAAYLELEHPLSEERLRFESPLPVDLTRLLERLRSADTAKDSANDGGDK